MIYIVADTLMVASQVAEKNRLHVDLWKYVFFESCISDATSADVIWDVKGANKVFLRSHIASVAKERGISLINKQWS